MERRLPVWLQRTVVQAVIGLPTWARRRLTGRPIQFGPAPLDSDLQLLLRVRDLAPVAHGPSTVARSRRDLAEAASVVGARPSEHVITADLVLGLASGDLFIRHYRTVHATPESATLVYLHGGGWVCGSVDTHDDVCRYLAATTRMHIVSVDYPLVPESRFPAAIISTVEAFRYLRAHNERLGIGSTLALGGDSAGGNIAAAVTHLLCEQNVEERPALLLLLYAMLEGATIMPSRRVLGAASYFLTEAELSWSWRHYTASGADVLDPLVSPLRIRDLSRFPPTVVVTAGYDPLKDEGEAFASRLSASGVKVEMRQYDTLIHGFANMVGVNSRCREAVAEIGEMVGSALRDGFAAKDLTSDDASHSRSITDVKEPRA